MADDPVVVPDKDTVKNNLEEAGREAIASWTAMISSMIPDGKVKEQIVNAFKASGGKITDEIAGWLKNAGATGATLLKNALVGGLASMDEKALTLALKVGFSEKDFEDQLESWKKIYENNPASELMTKMGMDPSGFEEVMKTIGDQISPLTDKEIVMKGIVFAGAEATLKKIKAVSAGMLELEKTILDVDKAAIDASIGFIDPTDVKHADGAAAGFRNARDAIDTYRSSVLETVAATQLNRKEVEAGIAAFGKSNLSFKEATDSINGLSIEMAGGERSARGLEAALLLARGTGLGMETVTQDLSMFTKQLGLTMKEATEKFGLYREVQEGTRLSLGEVHKDITGITKQFRFFGDTTDGVAASYKKFVGTLGAGKEALAAELFGQMAAKISDLDPGLKAFLGTVGGMGSGRGAIAGALEVEEAIASGDISGVMDSIREQIEKTSGAGLMTRQEAISSGQEEQFFLQRSLLKQFGIAGKTDEENTRILEMMAKGQEVQVKDIDRQKGLQEVAGVGRDKLRTETGVLQGGINVAEVTNQLGLTQSISEALFNTTGRFQEGSANLIEVVKGIKLSIAKWGDDTDAKTREQTKLIDEASTESVDKQRTERIKKNKDPSAMGLESDLKAKLMREGIETSALTAQLPVASAGELSPPAPTLTAPPQAAYATLENLPGVSAPTDSGGASATAEGVPGAAAPTKTGGATSPVAGSEQVNALAEKSMSQSNAISELTKAVDQVKAQLEAGNKTTGGETATPKFEIKLIVDGKEFRSKVQEVVQDITAKNSQRSLGSGKGTPGG